MDIFYSVINNCFWYKMVFHFYNLIITHLHSCNYYDKLLLFGPNTYTGGPILFCRLVVITTNKSHWVKGFRQKIWRAKTNARQNTSEHSHVVNCSIMQLCCAIVFKILKNVFKINRNNKLINMYQSLFMKNVEVK